MDIKSFQNWSQISDYDPIKSTETVERDIKTNKQTLPPQMLRHIFISCKVAELYEARKYLVYLAGANWLLDSLHFTGPIFEATTIKLAWGTLIFIKPHKSHFLSSPLTGLIAFNSPTKPLGYLFSFELYFFFNLIACVPPYYGQLKRYLGLYLTET